MGSSMTVGMLLDAIQAFGLDRDTPVEVRAYLTDGLRHVYLSSQILVIHKEKAGLVITVSTGGCDGG